MLASVIVGINLQHVTFDIGPAHSGVFGLKARPEDWSAFFDGEGLVRPYQSFWGVLRVLGHNEGIGVLGDQHSFGRHARLWRIVLDRARDAVLGRLAKVAVDGPPEDEFVEDDDGVVGKYLWLETGEYGRVKIFYEMAGAGSQDVLFLHTAGSDSRQYHSLMNMKGLRERLTMYAFDMPAHGRSGLGSKQSPQGYALNEEAYLEVIGKIIRRLKLSKTIVCGASMAGQICLAAAIKARELDVHGVIPCEACEHLAFDQPIYEIKGADVSLLDPERVCGMCAPDSPEYFKRNIWWQYSTQVSRIEASESSFFLLSCYVRASTSSLVI